MAFKPNTEPENVEERRASIRAFHKHADSLEMEDLRKLVTRLAGNLPPETLDIIIGNGYKRGRDT